MEAIMTRRINISISDQAYETLDDIAKRKGKTISAVIRDALAFEKWLIDNQEKGASLMIERDGKFHEIVRP